jgi:Fis family transcriptional regulator
LLSAGKTNLHFGNNKKVAKTDSANNKEWIASKNRKPLRRHTEEALQLYFRTLNGDRPGELYDLVLGEVEEPLFRAVMDYTDGNQSQAAGILGINRGTLRKKLKTYSLIQ